MKVKVLIATHKPYDFPNVDYYIPIQVGKINNSLDLGIQADNVGEHISEKNKTFCELTALYWAWKNPELLDCDYIGLVHYRRYFSGNGLLFKGKKIASKKELLQDLDKYDVIVAKKRNYYIESVYNHYKNAHYSKDLDLTKQIITQYHPSYINAFEKVISGKTLHLFNMFLLRWEHFTQYCEWLFDILFRLENQLDLSQYNDYQKRVFGFLSERLFNVWLVHNKLIVKERKVVSLEGEKLFKKAIGLLKRKYLQKR